MPWTTALGAGLLVLGTAGLLAYLWIADQAVQTDESVAPIMHGNSRIAHEPPLRRAA